MAPTVRALVRRPSAGARAALDAQLRPPDERAEHAGSWHDAVAAGAGEGADWLWLLEGDALPRPDALAELLAPLADLGDLPAPALMGGKVVGPDGRLHAASAPWPPLLDRVVVIAAAQHRLVSLRLARWGSLLVHRSVLERHGLPRVDFAGGADDLEWTARILRDERGYLAPRSIAVRKHCDKRGVLTLREARDRLRMVRGQAWLAQEPVWFAFMLAVDAMRDVRARGGPTARGPA